MFLLHKRRLAIRFRAKTKLIRHTDYPKFIGMPAVRTEGGRSVYGHVITKFSGMGRLPWARSIQPKFPEISVQNSMDRFGPTGKVSKKPFEVDQFSRSDRLEFWLNGSPPLALGLRPRARFARRAPLLLCAKGTQGQYLTNRKRKSKSWL